MIVLDMMRTITSEKKKDFYEDVTFLSDYNVTLNGMSGKTSQFQADLHGNVNILLGGAMISGVIIAIILMCYCCHKNARKYQPQEYSDYWRGEAEAHSLEVYTTDSHSMCYERQSSGSANPDEGACGTSCPISPGSAPGPPPPYDSLIFDRQKETLPPISDKKVNYPDASGSIVPSVVSALFRSCNRNVETTTGQRGYGLSEEGLPSYEAALQLDATGYV